MKKGKIFKWTIIALPLFLVVSITFIIGSSYLEHRKLVEQEKN